MANNFPNLKPALSLDMVNGIYVDPRITFVRGGGRTFFGREMVKAEENLLLNSVWAGAVSGTPGTVPTSWTSVLNNGSLAVSGAAIEFTALTGTRQAIGQNLTVVAGDVLTFSIDVDAVSGTGTDALFLFETVSGAVLSGSTKILVSDGTGRKTASTTVTTGGIIRLRVGASVEVNATTDCVATLKAPQIEKRSFATAYTPTTTQPITRYQRLLKTAAANEWPREFDPVTGECLGRSVWESRTNLLTYSEDFTNAAWVKNGTAAITSNQFIAPDGTLTADLLSGATGTTASGSGTPPDQLYRGFNFVASTTYVASVWIKAPSVNAATFVRFTLWNAQTGATSHFEVTPTTTWQRVAVTMTTGVTLATLQFRIGNANGDVVIWGGDAGIGGFMTPYIPTVASQVTRLADSAVMTGVNFSSWFNPEQGALFVDATNVGQNATSVSLSDGTTSNRINLVSRIAGSSTGDEYAVVVTGGAGQASLSGQAYTTDSKSFISYKFNEIRATMNGNTPGLDSTAVLPIVNRLAIGAIATQGCIYIKRLTYYPQALTAANLQAVTR